MKVLITLAAILFSHLGWAHGPTPQKAFESVEINQPVDKVWNAVKNFGEVAKWNPALSKSESEGGNKQGEKRTLTFSNGQQLVEELDAYDDQAHEYNYRLARDNVKALPVSSYSAVVKVSPSGQGSKIEWKSRLYRGDTGNFPSDELNDEAALKAMQAFFRSGLDQLKKSLESGG
ncbi:SRPBCC family protein [Candidatus Methylospira mobilis]|uniref:SRPBCC family protein n=1 Tax=Candidatus Methylospira mobilis TaxID=1808979 RepID=A0A5Q0BK84_9GAMM|nr:SRPBCC family protein [Candidatus Methylospira mobilis]QFY42604.1 SRPBCC family protein [Candidatus Methylospira mobilis]WNV04280.1 SRPBCC family protein [Candidatus Methylospira mobilis]